MTASAANGFGQVKYAPTGSSCTNLPYDFHPMYSTSSPQTTVPWAAATYNVAIDTEIDHFDYCSDVDTSTATCVGHEGTGGPHHADGDDNACFPAAYGDDVSGRRGARAPAGDSSRSPAKWGLWSQGEPVVGRYRSVIRVCDREAGAVGARVH